MDDVRKEIEEADSDREGKQEEAGLLKALTVPGKLATVDPRAVLEPYINGTPIPALANQLGVAPSSVSRLIRKTLSPQEWREAKELHYETQLDEGLMELRAAGGDCNVARAAEAVLRRIEWRASTECRDRWGQQPQTQVNVGGQGATVQLVTFSAQSESSTPNSSPNQ